MAARRSAGLREPRRCLMKQWRPSTTSSVRDAERVTSLSAFARATNKVPLDTSEVIREAIGLLQRELQTRRVSIQTGLMEAPPRVLADKVQIQQVVLNLAANAIDA